MKSIILAAGKGTRMKSDFPKVMHKICEKPMINWVIDTASLVSEEVGVVLGHGIDKIKEIIPQNIKVFEQKEQLGTGHAVMQCGDFMKSDDFLVLYGDVPLISEKTLTELIKKHKEENNDATLITVNTENPYGYGRIIRNGTKVKIVEHKDADEEQLKIKEINSGIAVFKGGILHETLKLIRNDNVQGEYYLTDVFEKFEKTGILNIKDITEVTGVNDRVQLAMLEKKAREYINEKFMLSGVTIINPENTYISPDAKIGNDTVIYPDTYINGKTEIGKKCIIGPGTSITECIIGDGAKILKSECENSEIKSNASVGPWSRIRPGSSIGENVKIGNFVETKKTKIAKNSKAQHLTYLGDATIGENVNIGAGTITCNYDGKNKFKTSIGDESFVGSNSSLVAPVNIGKKSLIAAGSVITKDVPDYSLAFGRAKQVVKEDKYRK
ncbi:MAG: bifunctional UDP-N-acetylglucosamine diphosphorylase/glucosamine-1-phosphate N-acetyltransferase GlmU [Thermotogae bacterium]|nr:bifunctional UDP-N-acetylglucosamine diphosphorylase/glucosamine-1-phosphate N-acetyltransferase GlmU [Thermotogota bacterium]MCP5465156.1 bifunctional UDP-N-acetylglucosamine diphosphorylase/glucosamine-1-phosphate N-acetyltransferase GlmU [Thermotogota bacterium]